MASLQATLRSQAALDSNCGTAELVQRLNRHLFRNTSDDRYATFFYAVYDADTKTFTYTNAGHLAPFLVERRNVKELTEGGTVVGLFEEYPYTQQTIHVESRQPAGALQRRPHRTRKRLRRGIRQPTPQRRSPSQSQRPAQKLAET